MTGGSLHLFLSFHVRLAWGSRPPCSIVVAGYACSHPFMVFNRVVSLLAVDLVVVGSLDRRLFECMAGRMAAYQSTFISKNVYIAMKVLHI